MRITTFALLAGALLLAGAARGATPAFEIYGAWHCGNDACTWATVRDTNVNGEFDRANHWLIGGANGAPAVNVVVLSFVNPLKLLKLTNDSATVNGVPRGMTREVVKYFTDQGVRVMLSIGGITYVKDWNTALATDARQLGLNAAAVAANLGVGIEIDYEENRSPNLTGLQTFINAYRGVHAYDITGTNPAARLTLDIAAGDRWLIDLTRKATAEWLPQNLPGSPPVLDYANAMVPARQPSVKDAIANWQEHVDGKPQYGPPIPPLAPARFTGSLWLVDRKPIAECTNFSASLQKATGSFVTSVASKIPGTSNGMLGYMFWAAECQGASVCTTPPNTCEGGVGVGRTTYGVDVPMQPLTRN